MTSVEYKFFVRALALLFICATATQASATPTEASSCASAMHAAQRCKQLHGDSPLCQTLGGLQASTCSEAQIPAGIEANSSTGKVAVAEEDEGALFNVLIEAVLATTGNQAATQASGATAITAPVEKSTVTPVHVAPVLSTSSLLHISRMTTSSA